MPIGVDLRFAEILDVLGKRLHVGCVMAAGIDWVEVSLPEHMRLEEGVQLRLPPSMSIHGVSQGWRSRDRVGFTYVQGATASAEFEGVLDHRPASIKCLHKSSTKIRSNA